MVDLPMELDTGERLYLSLVKLLTIFFFRSCKLQPSSVSLMSYTGQEIVIRGKIEVNVKYAEQKAVLPLLVVNGIGASLLDRNWLEVLNFNWSSIKALHLSSPLDSLISKHKKLFSTHLGTLQGISAKLLVEPNKVQWFFNSCPVPYCLKEKVEKD